MVRALAEERTIPLCRLLIEDEVFQAGATVGLAYDQAWSLFHYLALAQPQRLMAYLAKLRRQPLESRDPRRLRASRTRSVRAAARSKPIGGPTSRRFIARRLDSTNAAAMGLSAKPSGYIRLSVLQPSARSAESATVGIAPKISSAR